MKNTLRMRYQAGVIWVLLSIPYFFSIYRSAVFNTTTRDDYSGFLLSILGWNDLAFSAPYVYRIVPILCAVPFFWAAPVISFSQAPIQDALLLKAHFALSLLSYGATLVACWCFYHRSTHSVATSQTEGKLLKAAVIFLLIQFTNTASTDPIVIAYLSLLIMMMTPKASAFTLKTSCIFSVLILLSAWVNEKIFIILLPYYLCLWLLNEHGNKYRLPLLMTVMTALLYLIVTWISPWSANENQSIHSPLWANFLSTLHISFSVRGVMLNLIPCACLVLMAIAAYRHTSITQEDQQGILAFSVAFLCLVMISAAANVQLNLGRIAMMTAPLVLLHCPYQIFIPANRS